MATIQILWADDEVELLKPHILFMKNKGYEVDTVTNGVDAIDQIIKKNYDVVFLDENMPGISGLEALKKIKAIKSELPVVMITKSEAEHIMEDAIGGKIEDYLIKPVNPNQILLSLKKILENKRLIKEKLTRDYQQDFREITMALMESPDFDQWKELYKKLVYWELEMNRGDETGMEEVLQTQRIEANREFSKYIEKEYRSFVSGQSNDAPLMSHELMQEWVLPQVDKEPVFFFLVDNLRWDQWKMIWPVLQEWFRLHFEDLYLSILPTTTQYCRNALFAGMMPLEIEKHFPKWWSNDEDEGGKNLHEEDFLSALLEKNHGNMKWSYNKILNLDQGKELVQQIPNLLENDLNVVVYNFVDNLSHARTDYKIVRELAEDEAAYRSLTLSWFEHSPLLEALKRISENKARVIITTDHGSVRVNNPVKIVGDKKTTTNLRYKTGKNLNVNEKEVYEVKDPQKIFLPRQHLSSSFAFCKENDFFVYPNNLNHYAKYYKDTFQHGGISLEEMLIPFAVLNSR
jgi:CheY-like chemotaxis protein